MSNITWQDPPATARRGRPTDPAILEFAAALRRRSGQWAVLPKEFPTNVRSGAAAQSIRKGSAAFPKGEFEAASRTVDGAAKVFVRHIKAAAAAKKAAPRKRK